MDGQEGSVLPAAASAPWATVAMTAVSCALTGAVNMVRVLAVERVVIAGGAFASRGVLVWIVAQGLWKGLV